HSRALVGSVLLVLLAAGLVGAGMVMAPKPTENKVNSPLDPWLAVERELDNSDGVTPIVLIGEKGMPRYSQWHVSQPVMGESATQDGTLEVQTRSITYLELVRDPRHERY